MKMKLDLAGNGGFTLIEMLFGLAIFSIGIMAVITMQLVSTGYSSAAGKSTSNITWAADRIEELMALPYDHQDLDAGDHSVAVGNLTLDSDGIDNDSDGQIDETGETGSLSIQWTVTDDMPLDGTKTIQVTVTRTGLGRNKTVTLTQVIAEIL